tara:strand:- start:1135 stop:1680 length:546 start_codon:yes stop_codon:yes gene_type:complete
MQDIMDDCNPFKEVSILEIHGTQDNVTYWQGDPNNNDGWGAYPSIPNTISFFTNMFGLSSLSSTAFPDINPTDGSTVNSDKYTEIGSCTQVWLYTVDGGGHDWPDAYGNMDISASREAWLFFEQLCVSSVGIDEYNIGNSRKLIRIVDALGREVAQNIILKNQSLFYIYDDGSVEKQIILE